jgi:hypothetical protein
MREGRNRIFERLSHPVWNFGDLAQGLLKKFARFFVAHFRVSNSVAFQDPAAISIHHKDRMLSRVKQYGIRGLRPNSIQCEQLLAEFVRGLREHALQRTSVSLIEERDEGFQAASFLPEVSGWSNEHFQLI